MREEELPTPDYPVVQLNTPTRDDFEDEGRSRSLTGHYGLMSKADAIGGTAEILD